MSKRKRVVLNFQQKLEILQQLDDGKSGAILAKQYGIGTSTISDIKRNGEAILQFVSNLDCQKQISAKKTRKTAQNTDLDSTIYKWYVEETKNGASPLDSVICAKALEVNRQLTNGNKSFKASPGWLRHFKYRHGIKDREPSKEHYEGQTSNDITRQLKNILKRGGYTLENVYNADESVLDWKSLPNTDNKHGSDITVIVCTNANASHKLPLWVVGSDKKSKILSNHSVIYKHRKNGRIDMPLFEDWFEDVFIPEVKRRQQNTGNVGKILLIIDEAPWHPHHDILGKAQDKVDVFSLPNDVAPSIQPMDTEIKHSFKTIYRKKLLQLLLNKCCPIKQFGEEFTLKESISVIAEAWDSIPRTNIVQSWGRLLSDLKNGTELNDGEILEIVAIAQKITGLENCNANDVTRWLESDKEDYNNYNFVEDDMDSSPSSSEESGDNGKKEGPSSLEAYQCFDTVIQWFVKQEECNSAQLSSLESLRDLAATKICGKIKHEKGD